MRLYTTRQGAGGTARGDLLEHRHRELSPARLILSALGPRVSGVWRPVQAVLVRGRRAGCARGGGAGCGHWPVGRKGGRSGGHAGRGDCHGGCLLRRLGKGRSRWNTRCKEARARQLSSHLLLNYLAQPIS